LDIIRFHANFLSTSSKFLHFWSLVGSDNAIM
jgi:hypothetical protein